jgi:ABC-2 type transport system ATP-binding protein
VGVRELRELILKLRGEGKTIFLSTHLLYEVEYVSSSIGIIHQGKLMICGKTAELVQEKDLESFFMGVIEGA